jgi:glycosyltransferase involved in cell wall biosynthesis
MTTKRKKKLTQPQRKPNIQKNFQLPQMINMQTENLPKQTVSLSIIVKNEAKVITRMLESVWPILDYYVVVDTGSTDGTQDIIRKFFEEKGIPGEVVDHPWKNFEDARNKARELVKGKADFGFWIDADEELIIHSGFNIDLFKSNLGKVNGGNIKIFYGGQNYFRMQFFRADFPWYWYGPVHEVLISDSESQVGVVEGLHILVRPDGNSWNIETQQQKYEGHAKILEEYVANDPKKDPRWLFYLAQSWRDSGTPEGREKAIEWYAKRRDIINHGYWEECYFSSLMVASLKGQNNYPIEEVVKEFLSTGKYNKNRIEHLIPVISYYQTKKDYDIAYIYGLRAMQEAGKSPFPKSSLFIDESVYYWRTYDMHSISCWYSGRREEAKAAYRLLEEQIRKGLVPEDQLERIKANKKFFHGTEEKQGNPNKSLV